MDRRARIADRDEAEDEVQDVDHGEQSAWAVRCTLEARRQLRADMKYALPIPPCQSCDSSELRGVLTHHL